MRKETYVILAVCALAGMLMLCGDDSSGPDDTPDPVFDYSLIGTWKTIIPPQPGNTDTITIGFNLSNTNTWNSSDSSFYLYAIEYPDKYLYKRTGAWGIKGTSVELTGNNCQMIDINETTYILKAASDSILSLVISIDTTNTTSKIDTVWNDIPLINLGGIVKSFPIYKVFPDWCETLRSTFLKKRSY